MTVPSRNVNTITSSGHFRPALFDFLRDLVRHNNREWFLQNKERYERDVKQPMQQFITAFGAHLATISRHFVADPRPVGGSMFRIHRDTRFSKDKSPYKTAAAAHFSHASSGKDAHAPGFYLHLAPGECMGGGGLWHPDADALRKVRDRIVSRNREWKAVRDTGIAIMGETLKRAPAGYDPAHAYVEDLKRKDLYMMARFSEKDVCGFDFIERYAEVCRSAAPLMAFLTRGLGLAW